MGEKTVGLVEEENVVAKEELLEEVGDEGAEGEDEEVPAEGLQTLRVLLCAIDSNTGLSLSLSSPSLLRPLTGDIAFVGERAPVCGECVYVEIK